MLLDQQAKPACLGRLRKGNQARPHLEVRLILGLTAEIIVENRLHHSHLGRYVAAVVVLRDGDVLHARWSARSINGQAGAGHLIYMSIAESWAQRARILDLGRTDFRNIGLARFKRQLGADSMPLPYSYLPQIPAVTSAEHLSGLWAVASEVWRNLPLSVTHALGSLTYRYLA